MIKVTTDGNKQVKTKPSGPMALVGSRDLHTSCISYSEISSLARVELDNGRFTIGGRTNEVVQETEWK